MVNKAALKGMSDTIAALLPIVKADAQKMSQATGKALEGETDVEKEMANVKADNVQIKEVEAANIKTNENKLLSWLPQLSIIQMILAAVALTILIWRLQSSATHDKNPVQDHIVHSRAVYLKDIEQELIDARPKLNTSDRYYAHQLISLTPYLMLTI
jgi:hypothetical protein